MTAGPATGQPVPHWPGRIVRLGQNEEIYLVQTPPSVKEERDLALCVHGMSGAATNWTDLMAELAPDFDCAAVDLPGSGFSPPPAKRSGYSVRALAGTVTRLIETLGRGPVHLIGNSMGGAISIRLAAARPDLVKTLTLVSPVLPDLRPHRSTMHFPVLTLPFIGQWLVRSWAKVPAEDRVAGVYRTCYYNPALLHPDRFAHEVAMLRRLDELGHGPATLVGAARTLVGETVSPPPLSLWRAVRQITAPTLVLFGSHDVLVSPSLAAPAARAFGNARVEVLAETGHIGQMERPGAVADRFREMVQRAGMPDAASRLSPGELTST
jgi:pimeloyl-ACP methyl ester carboxylesterase